MFLGWKETAVRKIMGFVSSIYSGYLVRGITALWQMRLLSSLLDHDEKGEEKVERIKRKYLLRIVKYAREHTAYYRDRIPVDVSWRNVYEVMDKMAVLQRCDIKDSGEALKSDEFKRLPKIQLSTSGTTGIPLKYFRCGDYEISHQHFLYKFITGRRGVFYDPRRIVTFGGCYIDDDRREKGIFWEEKMDFVYGSCLFSCFYLTEENLPFYIAKIEKIKPTFIRSYPSALLLFVELCKRKGVRVRSAIEGIYVTSENVTQDGMRTISDFFNAPVHGQYGHSEACVFGFTENCGTKYYCSDLYGYVQVVDENGRHVKVGEMGRVVATSYLNRAMPFIKYETGDLAVYGGHERGFTILTQLLGRTQDYVLNEDNERIYIIVGQLSECFLPAINHVMHWQAIQDKAGEMVLKIVKKESYSQKDEDEIYRTMKANKVTTSFEYVEDIPLTKAGKRKYIIQNIPLA